MKQRLCTFRLESLIFPALCVFGSELVRAEPALSQREATLAQSAPQRLQYALIKEYSLNQIWDPTII